MSEWGIQAFIFCRSEERRSSEMQKACRKVMEGNEVREKKKEKKTERQKKKEKKKRKKERMNE